MSIEPTPLSPEEQASWSVDKLSPDDYPWRRSRSAFAVFFFFSLMVGCTLLRLALLLKFGLHEKLSPEIVAEIFAFGFQQDFLVALGTTLPLLFWLFVV